MGERITFRRNEGLITVKPYWRGNPVVKGRFVNRQHRSKQGIGNVLKWRFSPNPQRKEKRNENWEPQLFPLHSLQGISGDALAWLYPKPAISYLLCKFRLCKVQPLHFLILYLKFLFARSSHCIQVRDCPDLRKNRCG